MLMQLLVLMAKMEAVHLDAPIQEYGCKGCGD